ncbi:hypothetical protein AJ80_07890 [Polytolypa hystricis UAMH7299]|uniref:Cytochrome c oxidase assembly factor 3 n=1 Tax=Polytolypa hystricis (strain UAMH7299) TaxID=1447883 RepID=A0A2B7X9F1_POLH7|nr:hypothetical protein AJ80_07890 [Polytolypa hystricis UAMH7299]
MLDAKSTLAVLGQITFRSSYYDKDYRATAALQRARRPYIVRNGVTGLLLFSFCIGVFAFTVDAVGQDDFSDVKIPAKPKEAAAAPAQQQAPR